MTTLTGKFVTLKPMTAEHAEFVVKLRSSDHAKYINRGSASVEDQVKWINSRPSNEYNFIIYFQDKPVGQMSLYSISSQHKTAEAGRLIVDSDVPKGYPITFESILLIHQFAYYELKLNKLFGVVASQNTGATKFNDFIKMKREGLLRQNYIFDDVVQDGISFGLVKDEFIKEQEPFLKKIINLNKY